MKRLTAWIWAAALSLSVCSGAAASGRDLVVATITIVDGGPATVIHAASKLSSLEGASISNEDIIETSSTTSVLRLEFNGGLTLDLGPSSRVMVKPGPAAGEAPVAYLLDGWAKLSVSQSLAGKAVLTSPALDVTAVDRDLVLHVKGGESELFAESGGVQVQLLGKHGKASPTNSSTKVDRGNFMARHQDGTVDVLPRPGQAFVQSVPRAFMDTLPSRLALFAGKDLRLEPAGRLNYEDTQAWLNAEPRIRTRFLTRWKPLLQDEAFRRALTAQLSLHPEWQPVLYPPKPHVNEAVKP
ncbi:MAG: hypothetical protein EKK47_08985 [Burkholderiales bacterium]|nr:MAG: hypothetical protein EKK47_08985 [Burkholderiales bacterium]